MTQKKSAKKEKNSVDVSAQVSGINFARRMFLFFLLEKTARERRGETMIRMEASLIFGCVTKRDCVALLFTIRIYACFCVRGGS